MRSFEVVAALVALWQLGRIVVAVERLTAHHLRFEPDGEGPTGRDVEAITRPAEPDRSDPRRET